MVAGKRREEAATLGRRLRAATTAPKRRSSCHRVRGLSPFGGKATTTRTDGELSTETLEFPDALAARSYLFRHVEVVDLGLGVACG
jgi:hypothetical protein